MSKDKNKKTVKTKIINEFKEFISRGSVMDLAVGIIIGSAFTAIVTSMVNDVITPLIGMLIGGLDFTSLSVTLPSFFPEQEAVLKFGNFIQSVINFFIIALCVFLIIKTMNTIKTRAEQELKKNKKETSDNKKTNTPEPSPVIPENETIILLAEIRDLLKENKQTGK